MVRHSTSLSDNFLLGDRTPYTVIPGFHTYNVTEQLTSTGLYQTCQLGKFLRQRYFDELEFLTDTPAQPTLSLRSTDIDRCLLSGTSVFTCMSLFILSFFTIFQVSFPVNLMIRIPYLCHLPLLQFL